MINKTHMLPTLLVLVTALFINLPMHAKHSDRFMLGTYSYLNNGVKPHLENRVAMCRSMRELGYNTNIIATDYRDIDLSGLLDELDRNELDAWVIDNGWSPFMDSEYRYSVYPLSLSNHIRFEAEFSSEQDVKSGDGKDNQFWYASRSDNNISRIGATLPSKEASYGFVWEARRDRDKPGFIFSDLRLRWPNANGAYIRFGKEFHLYQNNPPSFPNDYIWISYRFKVNSIKKGLSDSEPLLQFTTSGYPFSGDGFSAKASTVAHAQDEATVSETLFRVRDYLSQKDQDGYVTVKLKVAYADLIAANLLTANTDNDPTTPDSETQMILVNLNPRVYWFANCDVELDYVEMEDQIYHDLASNGDFWKKGIVQRMQNIIAKSKGNINGFYTFDEPYCGQFDSFNLLQSMLKESGIKMFTATYDYQVNNIAVSRKDDLWYDHVDNFRKRVKPDIIAPDIYPIRPETMWNPPTSKEEESRFIQNMLDSKLIKIYRESKQYEQQDSTREFYPIVQVLGQWLKIGGKEQWNNWILPPTATQKSLLYLPLCFGPDGIIHFRARGFLSKEGYGDYGAMYSKQGDKTYPLPTPDPYAWPAVASTNSKVKLYGEMILDMKWIDSNTIGTSKLALGNALKSSLLKAAVVEKGQDAPYAGYVQCGFYTDRKGNPAYMLVNRRGDYFVPGNITQERYVPHDQYINYYTEAAPQTVILEFDNKVSKIIGSNPSLYDPITNQLSVGSNKKASWTLAAGEGAFVQLINSLPAQVKGTYTLKSKTILSGTVVLDKKATVTLKSTAELVLLPGSTLIVPDKSTLNLYGTVTMLGDAKIKVEGKFRNKTKKIDYASGSSIDVHGKALNK